jgi:hypothetical protein
MPKWLKILLIIFGCLILMVVGVIGVGVYWWNKQGSQFFQGAMQSVKDGQDYGKHADNAGCVTEAIGRYKHDTSFNGIIVSKSFLTGCLQTSRATPEFCNGVPRRLSFTDSAKWRLEQCRAVGLGEDSNCQQIFDAVQQHCETAGEGPPENENRRP